MPHISEYDVESLFIDRLESIGYRYADLTDYDGVLRNFRKQLAAFNAKQLIEAKGEASLSDAEFDRVLLHLDNHSVYESAKLLRDRYVLTLDSGKTVYLDFFSGDTDRNIYQVTHHRGLFRYLQLFVVSNSVQTKYFCNENEMQDGVYNPILKSLVFFWTDGKNVRINDLDQKGKSRGKDGRGAEGRCRPHPAGDGAF